LTFIKTYVKIFIEIIKYNLIKSGGGNGPVKPGNLRLQGAKSGRNARWV